MPAFKVAANFQAALASPEHYLRRRSRAAKEPTATLDPIPLDRQLKTVLDILHRFKTQPGVLLADDVGLGKTTVGALVAWTVAVQGKAVRILAPNKTLQRRWAEELERHVPYLEGVGARHNLIKQTRFPRFKDGGIQVTTHSFLTKGRGAKTCDLLIVDEAHRAKGESSAFKQALTRAQVGVDRILVLTATPLSIRLEELEGLLTLIGGDNLKPIMAYGSALKALFELRREPDVDEEANRLVEAAREAIGAMQPLVIRHGIDNLSPAEQAKFGQIASQAWGIPSGQVSKAELELLLCMDRLLELAPARKGERRIDPRFYTGWRQIAVALKALEERDPSPVAERYINQARELLTQCQRTPHQKLRAVCDAVRAVVAGQEKVLVFCHHKATAGEVLAGLEDALPKVEAGSAGPTAGVWKAAWNLLLHDEVIENDDGDLLKPIVEWLCSKGVRHQLMSWIAEPALDADGLCTQLQQSKPRGAKGSVPSIADAGRQLVHTLLDRQSLSTRKVLEAAGAPAGASWVGVNLFPGRLDLGYRTMGSWEAETDQKVRTLYKGSVDMVLAIFNSPFGPDVLVVTDRLSEGVDLHRYCRHLIHYELDPSPMRTLQRNGRIRRVGSWAAMTEQEIQYAYPAFGGTRDEKAVQVMAERIAVFGTLLGGVPPLEDEDAAAQSQRFVGQVLAKVHAKLNTLNGALTVK